MEIGLNDRNFKAFQSLCCQKESLTRKLEKADRDSQFKKILFDLTMVDKGIKRILNAELAF